MSPEGGTRGLTSPGRRPSWFCCNSRPATRVGAGTCLPELPGPLP